VNGRNHVDILLDVTRRRWISWKGEWQGQERLFVTHANLLLDGPALRLRAENPADCSVGILPAPAKVTDSQGDVAGADDGVFRRFSPRMAPVSSLNAIIEQVQPSGRARTIPNRAVDSRSASRAWRCSRRTRISRRRRFGG